MTDEADTIRNQADHHFLMPSEGFSTLEELGLHLRHRKMYDLASGLAGSLFLDYGCNNGYGTASLPTSSRRVVGVDVSPSALADAHSRFRRTGAIYVRGDGSCIPFRDRSFDAVLSFQVIEHIASYSTYLPELARVLAPAGVVVLSTPNARLRLEPGQTPWNQFHVHEFHAAELRDLLLKWFPRVWVGGLTAEQELYATEIGRLDRIRRRQRIMERNVRWRAAVLNLVKKVAPQQLRPKRRTPPPDTASTVSTPSHRTRLAPEIASRYSTADFVLTEDDLDHAIDLVAVCSVDGHVDQFATRGDVRRRKPGNK